MSYTDVAENRPAQVDPFAPGRPTLGPGYDWLLEFMRQLGRPLAFFIGLLAMVHQIYAPPEAKLDALTFGLFIGLVAALCGLRSVDVANARSSLSGA